MSLASMPNFFRDIYNPASAALPELIGIPRSWQADRLLLTIAGQESGLDHRRQAGDGPANSFWQFEPIGVLGVLGHRATAHRAMALCKALRVPAMVEGIHGAMQWNDTLALGMARLNLWPNPKPLPTSEDAAWAYYVDVWKPGKPRAETWKQWWEAASQLV